MDLVRAYSNPCDQVKHLQSLLELPRAARRDRPERPSKQVQKRLSDDETAQLIAAHRAGAGVKKLATQFGINRDTAHNILIREGALRGRGIQPDDLPDVIRLYQGGWSLAQLATKFGVSSCTVNNTLRRASVPIRPPGRPPAEPRSETGGAVGRVLRVGRKVPTRGG